MKKFRGWVTKILEFKEDYLDYEKEIKHLIFKGSLSKVPNFLSKTHKSSIYYLKFNSEWSIMRNLLQKYITHGLFFDQIKG